MDAPTIDDTMPDNERLAWALRSATGAETVTFTFHALKKLARVLRESDFNVRCVLEAQADGSLSVMDVMPSTQTTPVAGLVEVPCIKRNAGSVMQCLLAAELALAGVGSFIPADEAIDAMDKVGRSLPGGLRETAEGGLAVTPKAKAWTENYFKKIHG